MTTPLPQLFALIDHDALAHNVRTLMQRTAGVPLIGVVKADAYGHGAAEVAQTLLDSGVAAVGVATLEEALALRAAGIDGEILAWMWVPDGPVAAALAARITLGLPTGEHLDAVVAAQAATPGQPAQVFGMVDTGLGRSGVMPEQWGEYFAALAAAERQRLVEVTGVASHLASADDPASPATRRQRAEFSRAISLGRSLGLSLRRNHLANSAGTIYHPDTHYDAVRPGISLYGYNPIPAGSPGHEPLDLRPVLTLCARVVAVKHLPQDHGVSYNHTHVTTAATTTAVLPVGYADGVLRATQPAITVAFPRPAGAPVIAQQIGRVCMDQIVVDLGENPAGIAVGDTAVLLGAEPAAVTADQWAACRQTISYEVLTSLHGRVALIHRGGRYGQ